MDIKLFKTLIEHNYWAHKQVWDGVAQLSMDDFHQNLGHTSLSVYGQVVHTLTWEWIHLCQLRNESPMNFLGQTNFRTRASIRVRWDAVETAIKEYIAGLREEDLSVEIEYDDPEGNAQKNTIGEVLLQMIHHSAEHRGVVMTCLKQLGVKSKPQDFTLFLKQQVVQS